MMSRLGLCSRLGLPLTSAQLGKDGDCKGKLALHCSVRAEGGSESTYAEAGEQTGVLFSTLHFTPLRTVSLTGPEIRL